MKKIIAIAVAVSLFSACGKPRSIDGKTYDTYGLFNQDSMKNDGIEYRIVVGNVVWSIILMETIIAPIYFVGFSLYQPVGKKGSTIKGECIEGCNG